MILSMISPGIFRNFVKSMPEKTKTKYLSFSKIPVIAIIFIAALLCSCSSKIEESNKLFLSQYGEEVGRINKERDAFLRKDRMPEKKKDYSWRDSADILGISGTAQLSSAFVDTSGITLPEPKEEFLPDLQTLIQQGSNPKLPGSIFDVSYNSQNYSKSYKRQEVSFDDIAIPNVDVFGIETDLGEKEYLLVNRAGLQENIDNIKSRTTAEDKEIRFILVKEKRELKYRKKQVDLYEEELYEEIKSDNSKASQKVTKKSKKDKDKDKEEEEPLQGFVKRVIAKFTGDEDGDL